MWSPSKSIRTRISPTRRFIPRPTVIHYVFIYNDAPATTDGRNLNTMHAGHQYRGTNAPVCYRARTLLWYNHILPYYILHYCRADHDVFSFSPAIHLFAPFTHTTSALLKYCRRIIITAIVAVEFFRPNDGHSSTRRLHVTHARPSFLFLFHDKRPPPFFPQPPPGITASVPTCQHRTPQLHAA